MTGWRVGYVAAPYALLDAIVKVQSVRHDVGAHACAIRCR